MGMRVDYICKLCGKAVWDKFLHDAVVKMDGTMVEGGEITVYSFCDNCGGINDLTLTQRRTGKYLTEVAENERENEQQIDS